MQKWISPVNHHKDEYIKYVFIFKCVNISIWCLALEVLYTTYFSIDIYSFLCRKIFASDVIF